MAAAGVPNRHAHSLPCHKRNPPPQNYASPLCLRSTPAPLLPIARLAYMILTCRPSRNWRRILASPHRRRLRGRPLACCPLAPRPLAPPCPRRRSPALHHESPKPIWPCPPRPLPHRQLELRVDRFPRLSAPPSHPPLPPLAQAWLDGCAAPLRLRVAPPPAHRTPPPPRVQTVSPYLLPQTPSAAGSTPNRPPTPLAPPPPARAGLSLAGYCRRC